MVDLPHRQFLQKKKKKKKKKKCEDQGWFHQFFWERRFVNENYYMSRTGRHAFFLRIIKKQLIFNKNNYWNDFDNFLSDELVKGLSVKIEGNWKINFLLDY